MLTEINSFVDKFSLIGKVKEGYKFEKVLGEGAEGCVYKTSKENMEFAIKVSIKRNEMNKEAYLIKNIQINHPFLMKYFWTFQEDNLLFIVMEFCELGDLDKLLKQNKVDEHMIKSFFVQLILALNDLHSHGILHRDIKLLNVLVKNGIIAKLGDFGISKIITPEMKGSTHIGTWQYMSPEVHTGKEYGFESDVWAVGILMYQLCTHQFPFDNSDNIYMYVKNVVETPFKHIPIGSAPQELINIIHSMLEKDPARRPQIGRLLRHPFLLNTAREYKLLPYYPQTIIIEEWEKTNEKAKEREKEIGQLKELLKRSTDSPTKPKSASSSVLSSADAVASTSMPMPVPARASVRVPFRFSTRYKAAQIELTNSGKTACTTSVSGIDDDKECSVCVLLGDGKVTAGVALIRIAIRNPNRFYFGRTWKYYKDYYYGYKMRRTYKYYKDYDYKKDYKDKMTERINARDMKFGVLFELPTQFSNFTQCLKMGNTPFICCSIKSNGVCADNEELKDGVGQFKFDESDESDWLTVKVDVSGGLLYFSLNGTPLANAIYDPRISQGGVYLFVSMDGYNNMFPRLTIVDAIVDDYLQDDDD